MIRNYFKIAFRNLQKNKTYSFINILGLTLGLVCFLLIALYVFDELTFDGFHKNADKIYWWVFAIAGTIALLIALCTVSMKALKAAITNPVKSLRTE